MTLVVKPRDLVIRTADICDAHGTAARVIVMPWRDFGGRSAFHGPIETVECFEDNSKVREALEEPGQGRVLVVDGGGSLRCALVGGNLAKLAQDNSWAGVVVHGAVRDVHELAAAQVGVKALGVHPRRSDKRGLGARGPAVRFADTIFHAGDWVYADEDGLVLASQPLHPV
ncbi:MAG: ribonuclease E activity regulator RraA [Maricaulaceae bacterium]